MKQKNYNIEMIRLFSFLMVIVIHITNYFCRAYGAISMGEYVFAFVLNSISRISVPCFFMISGSLLLGRTESFSKTMKRVARFAGVLLVWTFIFYIFNNYYTHQIWEWSQFWKTPAEAHLWYLYAIIPLYFVLAPCQRLLKNMSPMVGKILVIVLGLVCTYAFIYQIDLHLQYVYFFVLGYVITQNIHCLRLKQGHWLAIFTTCNILNIIYGIKKVLELDRYTGVVTQYRNPLIVLSSVSFFIYMMQFREGNVHLSEKVKKVVEICCSCSFGVYLVHIIFLDIFKQNFTAATFSAYVIIPVLTAVITLLSVSSIYFIRKNKLGRQIT